MKTMEMYLKELCNSEAAKVAADAVRADMEARNAEKAAFIWR